MDANFRHKVDVPLIGAIDQGTSSTRFILFRADNFQPITSASKTLAGSFPKRDWFEMDPNEILKSTVDCIQDACQKVENPYIQAIGLTNQRETVILWHKGSGKPLYNAIVWCDNRTAQQAELMNSTLSKRKIAEIKEKTGLPIHPYFSALKIRWLLDNIPEVKSAVDVRTCLAGTVDSWLMWNLTGGPNGGIHVTDVTNASRTLLMNIQTLTWDPELLELFAIPNHILPTIRSSSEMYGTMRVKSIGKEIPLCGCLGDQQAALVGQLCLNAGDVKCTYGTGCFLLRNTGNKAISSKHGLLTTVAYQVGAANKPYYALEGSVAVAGGLVNWMRDNLGLIEKAEQIESLANTVSDTGDVYIVPAFAGLYAPYWEPFARGTICGLTQSTKKAHLARACHESVCFLVNDILEAMEADHYGTSCKNLRVDGKMVENSLLLQLQADLGAITVIRPAVFEATALGAAMMAAVPIGRYNFETNQIIFAHTEKCDTFAPEITRSAREQRVKRWKKAIEKSMNWVENSESKHRCQTDPQPTNNICACWKGYTVAALSGFSLMFVLCRLFSRG